MSPRIFVGVLAFGIAWAGNPVASVDAQTQAGGRHVVAAKSEVSGVVESSNQFAFDLYGRLRTYQGTFSSRRPASRPPWR